MTPLEPIHALGQADADREQAGDEPFTFAGPFFKSREAAAYIPCLDRRTGRPSLKAFYEWRRRWGVLPRANGSIAKADLDRVLRRRKQRPRVVPAASLANLRKRRA